LVFDFLLVFIDSIGQEVVVQIVSHFVVNVRLHDDRPEDAGSVSNFLFLDKECERTFGDFLDYLEPIVLENVGVRLEGEYEVVVDPELLDGLGVAHATLGHDQTLDFDADEAVLGHAVYIHDDLARLDVVYLLYVVPVYPLEQQTDVLTHLDEASDARLEDVVNVDDFPVAEADQGGRGLVVEVEQFGFGLVDGLLVALTRLLLILGLNQGADLGVFLHQLLEPLSLNDYICRILGVAVVTLRYRFIRAIVVVT